MKYGVWFVRLLFAAWMIPSGLNHFYPIFPQPMGSQPLSQELILALLDSNLFDLVKAVELLAGICVLLGMYTPLALLVCMPVSFCVFYWDAPLEGWGSRAAQFGYAVLLCNSLLCLAYFRSYRSMFAWGVKSKMKQLVFIGRLMFGAWMLVNGANYLIFSFWPAASGNEPLAIQLMSALVNSRLLDVAMALQMLAGAFILSGVFVPLALCMLMPVSTCALYWSVMLDNQTLTALLALTAFVANGLLMLAYIPYYSGVLRRHALALGETDASNMNFDALFTTPLGGVARANFVPAMIAILAAISFFTYLVTGRTAQFCVLMLMYPAFVLLSKRLHNMGYSAWLLIPVLLLLLTSQAIMLGYLNLGLPFDEILPWVGALVFSAFVLWCGLSNGQFEKEGLLRT